MKCKFPNKSCGNRYLKKGATPMCRLPEWKNKQGTCEYDKTIKAHAKLKKVEVAAGQKTLNEEN